VTRTLQEILLTEDRRPQVVDDCEQLIDNEVAGKNGASGLAIKASYKIVKAVRPDMIRHASDKLLTDFVPKLEPFYAEYTANPDGKSLPEFFAERADQISDALLSVTDQRAGSAKPALAKAYEKLRPQAKAHVASAVPNLSKLIEKHANA
jgi:hypothetical protein